MKEPAWQEAHKYTTPENIFKGEVGKSGGMELIIKQKGSAGSADPLDQRSTVGWKGMKTAEILMDNYIVRVESMVKGMAPEEN